MDSRTEKPFVSLDHSLEQFAADVRYYLSLTPRQLPSRYFYDDLGSALFEAICRLPWYTITRAEMRLLAAHGDGVFRRLPSLTHVVELGPGNGEKLRTLLEAASRRQKPMDVHLIDVSPSALAIAAQAIGSVGDVRVITHQATYDAGLREALTQRTGRTLVAFLGSNIGNFDPPGASAFLHLTRRAVRRGDWLLLGVDLVKPERDLMLAYDDPLGVTAAFNRNLLVRINRELGGDFDLSAFAHRAVWDPEHQRIEMHLVSVSDQIVRIPASDSTVRFASNEWIWTESSYKYTADQIVDMGAEASFTCRDQWLDDDAGFALTLFTAL